MTKSTKSLNTITEESDSTDISTDAKTFKKPAESKKAAAPPHFKVYQGYNPIEKASLFSRLTFSWLNPVIAASHAAESNAQSLSLEMLGKQRAEDKSTQSSIDDLEQKFKAYLAQGSQVAILRAVVATAKKDLAI